MSVHVATPKEEIASDMVKISEGLKVFEALKTDFQQLKEAASKVDVASISDKTAIKSVAEMRKKLKAHRVDVQKQGKALRDPLTLISRNIIAMEAELVNIIEPEEKRLQGREDWVEEEQDKIAQEKLEQRLLILKPYNNDTDHELIKKMSETAFSAHLVKAQAAHDQAKKQEAEALKKKQEEEQMAAQQQESLQVASTDAEQFSNTVATNEEVLAETVVDNFSEPPIFIQTFGRVQSTEPIAAVEVVAKPEPHYPSGTPQEKSFVKAIAEELPLSLLGSVLDWIRDNMNPDQVFTQQRLNEFVGNTSMLEEVFEKESQQLAKQSSLLKEISCLSADQGEYAIQLAKKALTF